ncbi:MAG: AsmA family protein [Bacteroidales bacterium]|nr:AsmA family protein [Bacteroidales bacterium]
MRILKKIGIGLLAFVLVIIIAATIALWYVFTPEKITPIVNDQAKKYLSCQTNIEKVEPGFFSSFPLFRLELSNISLIGDTTLTKSDTLLSSDKCFVSFDLMDYLFHNNITLTSLLIENGYLNFKTDSSGHTNFDIFIDNSDSTETDTSAFVFGEIDIANVEFKNFNIKYTDESTLTKANIENLNAKIEFLYDEQKQYVDLDMQLKKMLYTTSDSMALYVDINECDIKINSKSKDKNLFNSDLKFICESVSVSMKGDTLLSDMKFDTHLPVDINLSENSYDLAELKLIVNDEQELSLSGNITLMNGDSISTDLNYASNTLDIEKIIALIPNPYSKYLEGITAKGFAQISGSVKGLYFDTLMPLVNAHIEYEKGEIKYEDYPVVKDIKLSMSAFLDMNNTQSSDVKINSSYAKIMRSSVSLKGDITNILEIPVYDIYSDGDFNLDDFKPYIPEDQNVIISGLLNGNMHARFSQSDIDNEAYHRIYVKGQFRTQDFYAVYDDSLKVDLALADIKLLMPGNSRASKDLKLANLSIAAPNMDLEMVPTMAAVTKDLELSVDINNMVEGVSAPITYCEYKVGFLYASYDTLAVTANNAEGHLKYAPELIEKKEIASINSTINSQDILIASKDNVLFDAKKLYTKANLIYDESESNLIDQWQPELDISFSDASYNVSEQLYGQIISMKSTLTPDAMEIEKFDLTIADSDYKLSGKLTNISNYLNDEGLLKGDFNLLSKSTDVYQLMDIFDGLGSEDSTMAVNEPVSTEDDPFMVPMGVDFHLNTKIDKTIVNENVIENIRGGLTIKDGTLVLDQMGFTNKAAHMQLTAMYRSARKNHLFTAIDFHLLNIDIAELVELMPYVDTIVPMLKSFEGRGEFHLAGECYLKSDYSLKESTIRGAAAFEGQQLTIMDNTTFDMIARKLQFEKKTENIIDSLSVEMTLFKDEIDLYPFLIVMDDYKAVISGRHTTDNLFKYHISVTDTPLPLRLGLDITGTIEDLDYKLAPCQYKHLYNPQKQGVLEERTLRLKKMISESLKENVKPIE